MSYSLNWKALSSKLNKQSSKKSLQNGIKKKKSPKTQHKDHDIAASTKITSAISKSNDVKVIDHEILSPLEAALWSKENEITAGDIPRTPQAIKISNNSKHQRKKGPGKYLSMDCEFVGVGPEGKESALARVSIVNFYGVVILDTFVKPSEKVTDWRTWVSGVSPFNMKDAITFQEAQKKVADLLKDKILVGHSVNHDLEALFLSHPKFKIRDTSKYGRFKEVSKGKAPGLQMLSERFLNVTIQTGAHSSVEDARATMVLFRMVKKDFEKSF